MILTSWGHAKIVPRWPNRTRLVGVLTSFPGSPVTVIAPLRSQLGNSVRLMNHSANFTAISHWSGEPGTPSQAFPGKVLPDLVSFAPPGDNKPWPRN
jgi:hypothetical protein